MPEPTQEELREAEALLAGLLEYQELVKPDNRGKVFRVGEAAKLTHLSDHIIRQFCEKQLIRGAILYPEIGWRIPYSGLVCFVANQYRQSRKQA